MPKKRVKAPQRLGFRSGLEVIVSKQIEQMNIPCEYEKLKIRYTIPLSHHVYTPDFQLPNGIIIETKGRFLIEDRKKHQLIREQHPHLDIRFVFTNSKAKINKGAKSTYADWCIKNNFKFADKQIPKSWFNE